MNLRAPPGYRLNKWSVYRFHCNDDGLLNTDASQKKHFFVILSHSTYNQHSNSYLGIPITHNTKSYYTIFLTQDDIEDYKKMALTKGYYETLFKEHDISIRCDKLARLPQTGYEKLNETTNLPLRLSDSAVRKIKSMINSFLDADNNYDEY